MSSLINTNKLKKFLENAISTPAPLMHMTPCTEGAKEHMEKVEREKGCPKCSIRKIVITQETNPRAKSADDSWYEVTTVPYKGKSVTKIFGNYKDVLNYLGDLK